MMTTNELRSTMTIAQSGQSEDTHIPFQNVRQNSGAINPVNSPRLESWKVKDVAARLPGGAPIEGSDSPIPFFHMIERLKTTPREGFRRFGVKNCESIADHMYRMAIMTMIVPESLVGKINISHCTNMALIHDMAESLVGDITPVEGVPKTEKNRRESTTMDYLTRNLLGSVGEGKFATKIREIWQEYEDAKTLESKFVHDIDKVELLLQMVEYERANGCKCDLGELTWVTCKIVLPEIRSWADFILVEREELWGGREHVSYTAIQDPAMIMEKILSKSNKSCGESNDESAIEVNGKHPV